VACGFRDHVLSDLIGFKYASWSPESAADDFLDRLVEAGRRFTTAGGRGEPVVFVILDGENAWEHFEAGGRPFLRALYRGLSTHPELKTVTMSEACEAPIAELSGIFPGSWIDANFYIWIGHRDDRRAWNQLADARDALASPGSAGPDAETRARDELLIAEGSDWFWWYGDDHSSGHDAEFDDLFRRHLRNVYSLIQKPVPDELFVSNISVGAPLPGEHAPTGLIAPTLDGEETSYFEWLGAGMLEVRDAAGAMHQADRQPSLVSRIRFGFDTERLFVCVTGTRRLLDLLAEGYEFSLNFHEPEGVRFSVLETLGRLRGAFWDHLTPPSQVERGPGGARLGVGRLLELAIPLADLRQLSAPSDDALPTAVAFFLTVRNAAGEEVERHPASRPIEAPVPDRGFEARNWTV
jgi:alpha-amylase/alpha-mannosidase (GH57 family)